MIQETISFIYYNMDKISTEMLILMLLLMGTIFTTIGIEHIECNQHWLMMLGTIFSVIGYVAVGIKYFIWDDPIVPCPGDIKAI